MLFADYFSNSEIMHQPGAQIPWENMNEIMSQPVTQSPLGTLVTVIMPKSNSHEEMLFGI